MVYYNGMYFPDNIWLRVLRDAQRLVTQGNLAGAVKLLKQSGQPAAPALLGPPEKLPAPPSAPGPVTEPWNDPRFKRRPMPLGGARPPQYGFTPTQEQQRLRTRKAGPVPFRQGGTMMADEPMVGMGMMSGMPRFMMGEAGPEMMKVTPMKGKPKGKPTRGMQMMAEGGTAQTAGYDPYNPTGFLIKTGTNQYHMPKEGSSAYWQLMGKPANYGTVAPGQIFSPATQDTLDRMGKNFSKPGFQDAWLKAFYNWRPAQTATAAAGAAGTTAAPPPPPAPGAPTYAFSNQPVNSIADLLGLLTNHLVPTPNAINQILFKILPPNVLERLAGGISAAGLGPEDWYASNARLGFQGFTPSYVGR